ncbi:2-oxo acid dehydrogenase subunit E2 [Salicibibacter cibarius]|uniref:Dihydrolipoamide acetyltransferase component of pyruvate dehydrogenase complex n=1 Tax=Salicibibacter cibarius TaxID=2743000 RepID=A0A7T6Z6H6_9BACI|nr:dihydrolipoamide acetyltransferase family protein [Salicibibacter cibarius]QQK77770.1 2-oxo acid dehydrogenase subunit E2 [Salicibibacter cibarius]
MSYEFKLPDIGEGLHEAEIVRWFVDVGDTIRADEIIAEVQTDKAVVEMTSPVGGRILALAGDEGDVVTVGNTLITLDQEDKKKADGSKNKQTSEKDQKTTSQQGKEHNGVVPKPMPGRVIAAPVVRKRARELGINITEVTGSAKGGRIIMEDLENFENQKQIGTDESKTNQEDERIPVRGLRKKIAEKMVQSKYTAPHVSGMDEVDVTELVGLRKKLNQQIYSEIKLTYLPFIIKAMTTALKEHSYFNASYDEEKEEIVLKKRYNIGIATATKQGLVVPVIKDADKKSLFNIAVEIKELVQKAHEQKLNPIDIQDGTFTITSTGIEGGWFATPIINYPEVAIFGAHTIKKRPVVVEDEIVIRKMMGISITFDHRVIDGEPSGRFMQTIKRILEHPELLLLDVS